MQKKLYTLISQLKFLKRIGITCFLFFSIFLITSCGEEIEELSGKKVVKTENISIFNKIVAESSFAIEFVQDSIYFIELITDERYIDAIKYSIKSETLILSHGIKNPIVTILARVHSPVLQKIELLSSSSFLSKELLKASTLEIETASNAKCTAKLEVEKLSISASSFSEYSLSGKVQYLDVNINGNSFLSASVLYAQKCCITCSGNSISYLHVRDSLFINASGYSRVRYTGTQNVNISQTGASTIIEYGG